MLYTLYQQSWLSKYEYDISDNLIEEYRQYLIQNKSNLLKKISKYRISGFFLIQYLINYSKIKKSFTNVKWNS